jgi:hypothetical protein
VCGSNDPGCCASDGNRKEDESCPVQSCCGSIARWTALQQLFVSAAQWMMVYRLGDEIAKARPKQAEISLAAVRALDVGG